MLRRAIDLSRVPPITGPEDKVTLMCGDLYEVIQLPWLGCGIECTVPPVSGSR